MTLPSQLRTASFATYPPQAREIAVSNLILLRQLPLPLLPILLSELITYDWKLPAERSIIDGQITCLSKLPPDQLTLRMQSFAALQMNDSLRKAAWADDPVGFVDEMTAWLWSSQQMDTFHAVVYTYTSFIAYHTVPPKLAMPRLAIVVIGQGVEKTQFRLFKKLRSSGVFFSNVTPGNGVAGILDHASRRARQNDAFAHWYIDGGTAFPAASLTNVSYDSLAPVRTQLLALAQKTIASGASGPEALRTQYARLKPADLGLAPAVSNDEAVLRHFQLSLFTDGSGTQIFATTFVQWAARECLRRAQPETIVLRYAPRQHVQTMNQMLSGAAPAALDPEGSLIDADMGAYYTWLNLQRLPAADDARFLVWFEGHSQALAIGPGLARGSISDSPMTLPNLLKILDS